MRLHLQTRSRLLLFLVNNKYFQAKEKDHVMFMKSLKYSFCQTSLHKYIKIKIMHFVVFAFSCGEFELHYLFTAFGIWLLLLFAVFLQALTLILEPFDMLLNRISYPCCSNYLPLGGRLSPSLQFLKSSPGGRDYIITLHTWCANNFFLLVFQHWNNRS